MLGTGLDLIHASSIQDALDRWLPQQPKNERDKAALGFKKEQGRQMGRWPIASARQHVLAATGLEGSIWNRPKRSKGCVYARILLSRLGSASRHFLL